MYFRIAVAASAVTIKQLLRSKFYLVLAVFQPVLFVSAAGLLAEGDKPTVLNAATGAAVMGMWSTTLYGAGGALQRERRYGTLDQVLIAPVPLLWPLFGICVGSAGLGLLSVAAAIGTAASLDAVPSLGAVAMLMPTAVFGVLGMSTVGLLIAGLFVLLRQASVLANMLEYPVWICCALLVPVHAVPWPLRAIGVLLPPTWIGRSMAGAARVDVNMVVSGAIVTTLLALLYIAASALIVKHIAWAARAKGETSFI